MREILFRGKDKDDGNWYEGYYLQLHDTTYCCMLSDKADEANRLNKENEHHYIVFEQMTDWALPNKHLRADVDPSTVCQYTGLTDKNGRKIFVGDIVKIGLEHYEVWWNCDSSSITLSSENESRGLYLSHNETIEVIGNIFDNPDLIGG